MFRLYDNTARFHEKPGGFHRKARRRRTDYKVLVDHLCKVWVIDCPAYFVSFAWLFPAFSYPRTPSSLNGDSLHTFTRFKWLTDFHIPSGLNDWLPQWLPAYSNKVWTEWWYSASDISSQHTLSDCQHVTSTGFNDRLTPFSIRGLNDWLQASSFGNCWLTTLNIYLV